MYYIICMKIIISKITAYFYIALWHVRHCSKCFTMYLCNSHFMKVILKCKGLLSDTGNWRNRISIVKVKIFLAQLCLTLCDPMDCSPSDFSDGIFPTGDLPDPRIEPRSLKLQVHSLPSERPGKPCRQLNSRINLKKKVNISIFVRDVIIDINWIPISICYSNPETLLLKLFFVLIPDRKVNFDFHFFKVLLWFGYWGHEQMTSRNRYSNLQRYFKK